MSEHFPALLVTTPLIMAFVTTLHGWLGGRHAYWFACATATACLGMSATLALRVLESGPILYKLGNWPPPIGISYKIDGLNAAVLAIMALCAWIALLSSREMARREYPGKGTAFYALCQLALTGHLGMSITADAFNLYVLLEITALSGYALLAVGRPRAWHSTLNYLFIGTIGASFYLLGVGFLYIKTGSLDMADIAARIQPLGDSPTVLAALALVVCGMLIKMACFPMHAWLPNVYANTASPAATLLAPMTTKVMVYVVLRLVLTVFTPAYAFGLPGLSTLLVWTGTAAIVAGALQALATRDVRRMLCWLVVSEVGYMVGGTWLGARAGMTGAALHVVNDALMTLTVFLAAGCLASRLGKDGTLTIDDLKGAFATMPVSMAGLVLGAMALIGVPPFCGFYSKWQLLLGGMEAGAWGYVAALLFSSLVNVVLFFRIFETALFDSPAGGDRPGDHAHAGVMQDGHAAVVMHEAHPGMTAPLLLAAAGCVALGFATPFLLTLIESALPASLL